LLDPEEESNVIKIQDPITIVGDIHGQFYDFIKVLLI
jgi:serine/threonine-protein phosphatase 2B catalytic subunit